jgi:hypothetical protein
MNGRAVDHQLVLDIILAYLSNGLLDRGVITHADKIMSAVTTASSMNDAAVESPILEVTSSARASRCD